MRMLGAAVAMAAVWAAVPARAADQAPIVATLAIVPVAAAAASATPADEPVAILPTVALAGRPEAAPAPRLPIIRPGFGYSSTSFYPLQDSGLHLTVGTRVATRALAGRTMDAPWANLLWAPRGSGLRSIRRMSPAAFVGVDRPIAEGTTLGLDAGVAKGHINYFNYGPRAMSAEHVDRGGNGMNPLARMTLAYRF